MATSPRYERAVNLMEADLGDDIVALDPNAGQCFGFNEVAAWVWKRLDRPATFHELRSELLATYDVGAEQCEEELRQLLDEMQGKGLVRTASEASGAPT